MQISERDGDKAQAVAKNSSVQVEAVSVDTTEQGSETPATDSPLHRREVLEQLSAAARDALKELTRSQT